REGPGSTSNRRGNSSSVPSGWWWASSSAISRSSSESPAHASSRKAVRCSGSSSMAAPNKVSACRAHPCSVMASVGIPELAPQPRLRERPPSPNRPQREVEHDRDLLQREPAEVAELDGMARLRADPCQLRERLVERDQVLILRRRSERLDALQGQQHDAASPLHRPPSAPTID